MRGFVSSHIEQPRRLFSNEGRESKNSRDLIVIGDLVIAEVGDIGQQDDCSAAGSKLDSWVKPREEPKPGHFKLQFEKCSEISYFGARKDVLGNGQCRYISTQRSLINHFGKQAVSDDPILCAELDTSFDGNNVFRMGMREFMESKYLDIIDGENPLFCDEWGDRDLWFKINTRDSTKPRQAYGTQILLNNIQYGIDCIYSPSYFEGLGTKYVIRWFWMKADFVLPGVAVKYQVSIFFYSQNGARQDGSHGRTTTVFLYCNEKCQSFRYDDFRITFRGVLGLYLSGDHYNWMKFHDNFNNWAPQPIMIGSSDDRASPTDLGMVDLTVASIPDMDAAVDLQAVSILINPHEFTNQPALSKTT